VTQLVKLNARLGAAYKTQQHTRDAFLLLEMADDVLRSRAPAARLESYCAPAARRTRQTQSSEKLTLRCLLTSRKQSERN
jgi:hypothetical protein